MTLPNFFVIGASRAGTTSLHHYLGQHPDVFLCPEKSPNFFVSHESLPDWEGPSLRRMAQQWVSDPNEYEALFDAADEEAIGEVSPVYLQASSASRRIHQTCPDARLVAILRDPVDRAYAHYLGRRRDGLETRPDFREVITAELAQPLPEDVAFGSYLGCGRYHHFLAGYYELFAAEQIRVYLFEDLDDDAGGMLADLFTFLGVDPAFVPHTQHRYAQTGVIRNPVLRFAWTRSVAVRTALRPHLPPSIRDAALPLVSNLGRPALDAGLRSQLVEVFREDVQRLEGLIDRDLSDWLRGGAQASSASP